MPKPKALPQIWQTKTLISNKCKVQSQMILLVSVQYFSAVLQHSLLVLITQDNSQHFLVDCESYRHKLTRTSNAMADRQT